jgi:hypothetical protein
LGSFPRGIVIGPNESAVNSCIAPPLTPGVRCNRTMTERLSLQDAARELGITPDALRQRIRRGQYRSEKSEGRVYVYLDTDRTETEHDVHPEPESASSALIYAKDETITLLREQLGAERAAHAEARRLLAAALERIPPQIEAPSETRESPETATVEPERAEPRLTTEGTQEPRQERRSWWRRMFGG